MSRRAALLALLLSCMEWNPVHAALPVPREHAAVEYGTIDRARSRLVIGGPGRLDDGADRRVPRRYQHADSTVAAYVDIDEVRDPTWLRHEIERYARDVSDCAELGAAWCRREVLTIDGTPVLYVAAGVRAEALWLADGNRAVRLGWRRVVETASGTLTIDTPPADFATELLAELPGQMADLRTDAARDAVLDEEDVDRLLYYIDQSLAALPSTPTQAERDRAANFVGSNVGRIARLLHVDLPAEPTSDPLRRDAGAVLSARLVAQLAAVRAWREMQRQTSNNPALPWCSAALVPSLSSPLVLP